MALTANQRRRGVTHWRELVFGAFEPAVEILVRTDHQQLQCVFIQDAVGEQAQQGAHAELVNPHASQVTNVGFTRVGLAGDGSHRFVKRGFLLLVQLLNDRLTVGL